MSGEEQTMGQWVEIQRSWHDNTLTNCALCGRLVPRRMWQVEIEGKALPFCDEACEGLYRSYWLPKYGKNLSFPDSAENAGLKTPR